MQKNKPRNAFYFFMLNFREEQKDKGIFYNNMAEVADAAGPIWKSAPPNIRKMYTIKAAEDKRRNSSDTRMTSTGVSVAEIEARQQELKDAEIAEVDDIEKFVTVKHIDKTLAKEDIFLMDVNSYCRSNYTGYLIGEVTILRFSLLDGIKDNYHCLINPDNVPYGYGSDIKLNCKAFGLEMPDESAEKNDYIEILDSIVHYLKQWDPDCLSLPIIYTMPDKLEQVYDFMSQLCSRRAGLDIAEFRIYKLNTFFNILSKTIVTNESDVILTAMQALSWLEKDIFIWAPRAGCKRHNYIDMALECTTSRVKRWAYTVLDKTARVYGPLQPGKHVPAAAGADIHDDNSSSGNSSLVGSTNDLSFDHEIIEPRACAALHPPVVAPPPPPPPPPHGRGRGKLFEMMKNMKLNKYN